MNFYDLLKATGRPIIFFDLETTGLDIETDRIIELAAIRYRNVSENSLAVDSYHKKLNPEIEMSPEAMQVTGLSNTILKDEPKFKDEADYIYSFFKFDNPVIVGYNHVRFDVPLLSKEFARCGKTFPMPETKYIDVLEIFRKKFQRTLDMAYRYYVSPDGFEGAHSAFADTQATVEVFRAQIERYDDLGATAEDIHSFCGFDEMVDFAGYLKRTKDGTVVFSFGKNKGQDITQNGSYLRWMLSSDFPAETKIQINNIIRNSKTIHI